MSRFNNKMNRFVARSRDSWAFLLDALVTLWDQFSLIYNVPPSFRLQLPPSSALQDQNRGSSNDPHYTKLAQESIVLGHPQTLSRLSMGTPRSSGPFVSTACLLFCFPVAVFNNMSFELQALSESVTPTLLKARYSTSCSQTLRCI